MSAEHRAATPLPSSLRGAAKVGAYGGIAVAAWLAGSVATGHGVASADATGTSSGSSSASSAGGSASGGSSTAHAGPRSTGTAKARGTRAAKPAATAKAGDSTGTAAATTVTVPAAPKLKATSPRTAVSSVPAAVSAPVVTPNPLGLLNSAVTSLLNPFLKPAPTNSGPIVPIIWSALGAVRRDVFNQAPTIGTPTTTVQTGQTVTGNVGATDAEGDALKYTVTQGPKYGTLTIDQATGNFTYTPDDINYSAAQTDSFTISVTDGKFNVLMPFSSRTASASSSLTVLSPEATRVILNLPATITNPTIPRFAPDGKTLMFSATPVAGGRTEIYSISADDTDGSTVTCVTCGVTPSEGNLGKSTYTSDGSGRFLVEAPGHWDVYQPATETSAAALIPIITPPSGSTAVDKQREMRISPDGKYVMFSQIQLGTGNLITAVPIVGKLVLSANATTGAPEYHIEDARVVYPVGEGKQWTPDGKGVIILAGRYESGNVDDVVVDLATGNVTRLTGNLDYDEDVDMSPNQQWIAICSTRGLDALTPMTRIDRPALLPADIQGAVYTAYAGGLATPDYPSGTGINVSNQEWLVAIDDDLKGENGIPLFVTGDGYTARSMPSWNADGTSVAFWERNISDATDTRLVVTNLKYTTSVGTVQGDLVTPNADWAPALATYKAGAAPLPPVGAYTSQYGGTAYVSEAPDPTTAGNTIRTVTYTNYVNKEGMILNGTESTSAGASQASIVYKANIIVTGDHTGSLTANATINKLTRTITGTISSTLDGDTQVLLDPTKVIDDQLSA
ncbi:Tol biopolymer transport system component [Mycolicibacterium sp. BK556]|uniref:Ig-like domain-containing protein n=1 Tax=unclassified Mycolicibacterium TaxID=2636767 RepID=UPI00160AC5A8|nr:MULTISPECIES: PD40 domain-containing protein [unclassified Mycolicibacterium]MBB3605357.1 Tol biopolymer transport system component [Mycolicibacterium sp. BK556]MBB3635553.1 Tol biopolymer transport system component [Mycolicibacterium sp. BK607]